MRFLSSLPLLSAARAWNCESHLTQIPRGQSQVHARGLCSTMPEDVTDGLKRSSILEETQGVRVAHTMWALAGNVEPAFANQRLKGLRDSSWFQHAHGSAHSQEDSAIWWRWWCLFQMLHQRRQDLIGERQFQRRGGLALVDSQDALSPMDIVESDGHHLAGAQSVGGDQQKHRVVTQAHGRCLVHGLQKCANCFPR